jgi:hypothetical protein
MNEYKGLLVPEHHVPEPSFQSLQDDYCDSALSGEGSCGLNSCRKCVFWDANIEEFKEWYMSQKDSHAHTS